MIIEFRPRKRIERPVGNEMHQEALVLAGGMLIAALVLPTLVIADAYRRIWPAKNQASRGAQRFEGQKPKLTLIK